MVDADVNRIVNQCPDAKDRQANYEKYAVTLVKPFEGLKKQGSLNNWLLGDEKEGRLSWLDQLNQILSSGSIEELGKFAEVIEGRVFDRRVAPVTEPEEYVTPVDENTDEAGEGEA